LLVQFAVDCGRSEELLALAGVLAAVERVLAGGVADE